VEAAALAFARAAAGSGDTGCSIRCGSGSSRRTISWSNVLFRSSVALRISRMPLPSVLAIDGN
jgi:hypothetical protein